MTRTCGRLTLRGSTCRQRISWYEDACTTHATPADDEAALDRLRRATRRNLAHAYCPCPCHAVVQDDLIPCPRCDR